MKNWFGGDTLLVGSAHAAEYFPFALMPPPSHLFRLNVRNFHLLFHPKLLNL